MKRLYFVIICDYGDFSKPNGPFGFLRAHCQLNLNFNLF